jgi:hypothetical protein
VDEQSEMQQVFTSGLVSLAAVLSDGQLIYQAILRPLAELNTLFLGLVPRLLT